NHGKTPPGVLQSAIPSCTVPVDRLPTLRTGELRRRSHENSGPFAHRRSVSGRLERPHAMVSCTATRTAPLGVHISPGRFTLYQALRIRTSAGRGVKVCACGASAHLAAKHFMTQWGEVRVAQCRACGLHRDLVPHDHDRPYTDESGEYKPPTDESYALQYRH